MYELQQIGFAYASREALRDVCLTFRPGRFYGIIGPNGSGKSTLIDLLAGYRQPQRGTLLLDERPLHTYAKRALARRIAVIPQDFAINFPYTCREVVMMGRYPFIPRFTRPSKEDRRRVDQVLAQTGLADFGQRVVTQLSGGERQRVVFARGLAQATPVLLLDEATSNMDMNHTLEMLNLAQARVRQGACIIAVMQDINLAAMYCDHLVCLREGRVQATGKTHQVLTPALLKTVFEVRTQIAFNPFCNSQQVVFDRGRMS